MKRTQMIKKVYDEEGRLIIFEMSGEVKPIGQGAHILVPKELIGKEVKLEWKAK